MWATGGPGWLCDQARTVHCSLAFIRRIMAWKETWQLQWKWKFSLASSVTWIESSCEGNNGKPLPAGDSAYQPVELEHGFYVCGTPCWSLQWWGLQLCLSLISSAPPEKSRRQRPGLLLPQRFLFFLVRWWCYIGPSWFLPTLLQPDLGVTLASWLPDSCCSVTQSCLTLSDPWTAAH